MKGIVLLRALFSVLPTRFFFTFALVVLITPPAYAGDCPYMADIDDGWCCPSESAKWICWAAIDHPGYEEICSSFGCFPDHLGRIERERARVRKFCGDCQIQFKGKCLNCYELRMHCLHGRCLRDKEFEEQSSFRIQQETERQKKIYDQGKKRQEEFDRQHPTPVPKPHEQDHEQFLDPPTPSGGNSGRLVVKPCGNGIWSCGVCCCPNQVRCKSLPAELNPRGYGRLPSPDTLWNKCRDYGCWPPPHSYE